MVPDYPSFCRRAVHPCPLLRLVRSSPAIRVLVALRHRPSIFLFDRFSLPAAVPALHYPFTALCMCILACIRCEGWTGLDSTGVDYLGTLSAQRGRALTCRSLTCFNVMGSNVEHLVTKLVLNFISASRLDALGDSRFSPNPINKK